MIVDQFIAFEFAVAWIITGYFVSRFFSWSMKGLFGYDAVGGILFLVSVVVWPITGLIGIIGFYFSDLDAYE